MELVEAPDRSPATSFHLDNARLLSLLGRPRESDCSDSTFYFSQHPRPSAIDPDEITPVSSTTTAVRHSAHLHSAPLGPVPLPGLESAVHLWLMSHDIPPDQIFTGAAFCAAVGQACPLFLRRKLRVFRESSRKLGIAHDDIPVENDLRLRRSHPRVLHVLARVAAILDPHGWQLALEASHPPLRMPEKIGWRECVVDERWPGDWVVRAMAAAHSEDTCTIVVAGTQGGGKSATVSRLLGRVGSVESHAFSCMRRDDEMDAAERERESKMRHLRALTFPLVPVEVNVPRGGSFVDRTHVKVDGKMVTFMELPSMEESLEHTDDAAALYLMQHGSFEDVVADVQGTFVDYLLMVDRLDDIEEEKLRDMCRRLRRLYGKHALEKAVVVLTHGQGFPPGDLAYDVWIFDRIRVVREVLQGVHGQKRPLNVPVLVFENSTHSKFNEASGRPVLEDGTDFLHYFLTEFRQLVQKNAGAPPLAPIPTKRWWENYVVLLCFGLMASRILVKPEW